MSTGAHGIHLLYTWTRTVVKVLRKTEKEMEKEWLGGAE